MLLTVLAVFQLVFGAAEAQAAQMILASVLVPFATSLIVKPTTNKYAKLALAVLLSLIGGALTVFLAGGLTGSVFLAAFAVFMASQAHFASWFKGVGLDETLEELGLNSPE